MRSGTVYQTRTNEISPDIFVWADFDLGLGDNNLGDQVHILQQNRPAALWGQPDFGEPWGKAGDRKPSKIVDDGGGFELVRLAQRYQRAIPAILVFCRYLAL